ncbi:hypothetical protein LCGC14_2411710, partial [marine sediment metagenome]
MAKTKITAESPKIGMLSLSVSVINGQHGGLLLAIGFIKLTEMPIEYCFTPPIPNSVVDSSYHIIMVVLPLNQLYVYQPRLIQCKSLF